MLAIYARHCSLEKKKLHSFPQFPIRTDRKRQKKKDPGCTREIIKLWKTNQTKWKQKCCCCWPWSEQGLVFRGTFHLSGSVKASLQIRYNYMQNVFLNKYFFFCIKNCDSVFDDKLKLISPITVYCILCFQEKNLNFKVLF